MHVLFAKTYLFLIIASGQEDPAPSSSVTVGALRGTPDFITPLLLGNQVQRSHLLVACFGVPIEEEGGRCFLKPLI